MVVRYDRTHFSASESRLLGRHLADARRAAGVTKASLARRLKIPPATLGAYEAGRARLPMRLLFAAARALGMSPYQILAGRADRILNPWTPNLAELRRVRRDGGRRSGSFSLAAAELGDEPAVDEEREKGEGASREGAEGPCSVLKGAEAQRALAFLDEPGPGGRLDDIDDEAW